MIDFARIQNIFSRRYLNPSITNILKNTFKKNTKKFRHEIHAQGGHDLHIKYSKWFALKLTTFVKTNPYVPNGVNGVKK